MFRAESYYQLSVTVELHSRLLIVSDSCRRNSTRVRLTVFDREVGCRTVNFQEPIWFGFSFQSALYPRRVSRRQCLFVSRSYLFGLSSVETCEVFSPPRNATELTVNSRSRVNAGFHALPEGMFEKGRRLFLLCHARRSAPC